MLNVAQQYETYKMITKTDVTTAAIISNRTTTTTTTTIVVVSSSSPSSAVPATGQTEQNKPLFNLLLLNRSIYYERCGLVAQWLGRGIRDQQIVGSTDVGLLPNDPGKLFTQPCAPVT